MEDSPKIYVADIAAYNEGKLIGDWLDLSEYDSGEEVSQAIGKLIKKWSRDQGVVREEYSIHDSENIPTNLESEYMGEKSFESIIQMIKASEDTGLPYAVIEKWMSDTGHDTPESVEDAYQGEYEDEEDLGTLTGMHGSAVINDVEYKFAIENFNIKTDNYGGPQSREITLTGRF